MNGSLICGYSGPCVCVLRNRGTGSITRQLLPQSTGTNGQELRLRLVAVEHGSSVESSFVVNALALKRDIRGKLPSPARTTALDPTADDAVGRFVESEQMVVEAPQALLLDDKK